MGLNSPAKGSIIEVDPIMDLKAIELIKKNLKSDPRNYAIFVVGVNTAFRACDLLKLKISDIGHLKPGDEMVLREKKTGKKRYININKAVYDAVQALIKTLPDDKNDWLFRSERTGKPLTVPPLNNLVKNWCAKIPALRGGNYGCHSLRKTFAWCQFKVFDTPLYLVCKMLGHTSESITLRYVGLQEKDVRDAYMKCI